ncbi:hypothetical protein Ancab_007562 [Ancistrocladus abbreviatus]
MSNSSYSYTPSAPPMPDPYSNSSSTQPEYYGTTSSHGTSTSTSSYPPPSQSSYYQDQGYPSTTPPSASSYPSPYGYGYGYGYGQQHQQQISFPPGTDPEIIRVYQVVDRDGSGFIDDTELQKALSSGYYHFNIRTIRLLMFLFKNPQDASLRVGPKEFAALWKCLGEWRAIFQRFDKDRSGKIDATELRDALYSLGYAVPPSVLQLLTSLYDDGSRRKVELNFDSFIECGMIVKGLTEKFKEKDKSYTGSATLAYETFLTMVLPFLATYD